MLPKMAWFLVVIETAKENLEILDLPTSHHFSSSGNMVERSQGGGRRQVDYHLSRLACYHVALCCDSRGNEQVKQAKHYFAVKTREAEVLRVRRVPRDPSRVPKQAGYFSGIPNDFNASLPPGYPLHLVWG